MPIIQSLILGFIQGIAEFLPVSSTAHLIIVPYLFHWPDPGLSFDVAVHAGTLIAVFLYFWKDWLNIFKSALGNNSENTPQPYSKNLLWFLIIATIPGVIIGYLFESEAENALRNPLLIALTLSLFGLILFLTDKCVKHKKDLGQLSLIDSILIGLSQAVAIIPGVSRSGATMTTGLLRGLNRVDAARFSFLLSTPIILGAAVLKFPEFLRSGINISEIIAILAAAVSGYLAIKYLLKFIEKASYRVFFWYRIGLAVTIVLFFIFSK